MGLSEASETSERSRGHAQAPMGPHVLCPCSRGQSVNAHPPPLPRNSECPRTWSFCLPYCWAYYVPGCATPVLTVLNGCTIRKWPRKKKLLSYLLNFIPRHLKILPHYTRRSAESGYSNGEFPTEDIPGAGTPRDVPAGGYPEEEYTSQTRLVISQPSPSRPSGCGRSIDDLRTEVHRLLPLALFYRADQ